MPNHSLQTSTLKAGCVKAAMYVRMSTHNQKYSIEYQSAAIYRYAIEHNIQVIETYSDQGKSGLTLRGRGGLNKLLADVRLGNPRFSLILVFDVSRWGRFQDTDESAYYEYICRSSGVGIRYVAEQFDNDGSAVSTIVKSMKRAMAAEYSRELSNKVFRAKCAIASKGLFTGGLSQYGFQRMVVDKDGCKKGLLAPKQKKSFQSDKVVLVPGPASEIKIIKRIYKLCIEKRLSNRQIAARLNHDKIKTRSGGKWGTQAIGRILTNEIYMGTSVYNRRSAKLKGKYITNPREEWIRHPRAFSAIISPKSFNRAKQIRKNRKSGYTKKFLIAKLRQFYKKHGSISYWKIRKEKEMPLPETYLKHFGGILNAYAKVGYKPKRDFDWLKKRKKLRKPSNSILRKVGRTRMYTDEYMLAKLRDLLEKHHYLSTSLISKSKDVPCIVTYYDRFGSLKRIYEMIGYRMDTRAGKIKDRNPENISYVELNPVRHVSVNRASNALTDARNYIRVLLDDTRLKEYMIMTNPKLLKSLEELINSSTAST